MRDTSPATLPWQCTQDILTLRMMLTHHHPRKTTAPSVVICNRSLITYSSFYKQYAQHSASGSLF